MATKREREIKAKNDRLLDSCRRGRFVLIGNQIRDESLQLYRAVLREYVDRSSPGLTYPVFSQIIRALNSIGAAVHEGAGRSDGPDLLRFLKIARGSAYEALFHAEALELDLTPYEALADLVDAKIIDFIGSVDLADETAEEA